MANTQDKRNANGSGTVRKRSDGRWEARCTINGKPRSFYADKQSEALKKMRAAQKDVDDGTYLEPSKLTVGQWLDIWLEEYHKQSLKPGSYYCYCGYLKNHLKPAFENIKLQALNTTHVQKFINQLTLTKGLSPNTVEKIISPFSYALDQAVKLDYIKINPTNSCTLPKKSRTEIKPLTEANVTDFLQEIKGARFETLYIVTLFTGMRISEVLGLTWDEINFKDNTITIKHQLCKPRFTGDIAYLGSTKNGKSRCICVAPFVMDLLQETRKKQFKERLAIGMAWNNPWELVFTKGDGERLCHTTINKDYKRIVRKIGRSDSRFHDLRHTYAVNALQEGDSPKTVQENLGHSTANFTMNVYAHVSEKMKQDSAERMQAYYQKLKA